MSVAARSPRPPRAPSPRSSRRTASSILTLDVPGEKVNTLGRAMMQELQTLLGEIEARTDVRAIVLRSGKPDNFIAGADIKDFTTIRSALEGETLSRAGQAILDRLEALPVPVVAAIHGSCLGGGLETVLACRYRIATDDPEDVARPARGEARAHPRAGRHAAPAAPDRDCAPRST